MANSDILGQSQVAQTQNNKYITINDATQNIERSIQRILEDSTMSGNSVADTLTLSEAQFSSNGLFRVSGGAAAMTLETPVTIDGNNTQRLFMVHNNDTTYDITVQGDTTPGNTVVVPFGSHQLIFQDNLDCYPIAVPTSDSASGAPYDIGMYYPGAPTTSQVILTFTAVRQFELADDFAGLQGHTGTNPTSTWNADVQVNGGSIGTITFNTSGVISGVSTGPDVLAIGDYLEIIAPASVDATLADVNITLKATRTGV